MTTTLKHHPGMWLRDDAANAFNAMEDKYGPIIVNRAGVTEAEQQDIINKWDRGERDGLYAPARPAYTSLHVKDGGTAVDVYNFTDDRAKLREFGFQWYGSSDPVHYYFTGWAGNNDVIDNGGLSTGWVKAIQSKFARMGHDLGEGGIDGILGPRTREITRWEQAHAGPNGNPGGALTVDGIPGPLTNAYLDWWLNGQPNGTPSSKSAGELTYADIQAALNRKGYGLSVDNIWGPYSSNALADFQSRNGLSVDRLVGPATWAKLNTY